MIYHKVDLCMKEVYDIFLSLDFFLLYYLFSHFHVPVVVADSLSNTNRIFTCIDYRDKIECHIHTALAFNVPPDSALTLL